MGTIGINFGSASGGQGFDVAATVTQILGIEQGIETPWKNQLASLAAQDTALTSLGTDLSALTTALQALTDFTAVLAQKQGSSSDPNVLALTGATSNASAGSHTLVVTSLAQTSSNYSDVVATTDTLATGSSIKIQVGSGAQQTITVSSSSNTLASFAAAINAAAIGVNASVITDASGSRLSVVSGTGGAAGQLTVTSALTDSTTSTAVAFHLGQNGLNAALTVDGIAFSSASNTVTGAISGVTFQLLSAAPAKPVQVQITNDNASISAAFGSFVNAYNTVIKDINAQEGRDANGIAKPLFGDTTLARIQSQLAASIYGGAASGSIASIVQLGITSNNDGTLSINNDVLQSALNNNFADVTGFLQNTGSFGKSFGVALNTLSGDAPGNAISLVLQQNTAQELSLNKNVSNEDDRLAAEKISLTLKLTLANQILQSIPSRLNQVNEIYSAVTGYNTGTH